MDEAYKKRFDETLTALAEYQSRGASALTAEVLRKLLREESDRGLVILLVTYVEDRLLDRICKALPNGEKNKRSLTKGGPLRSFEHRLALARALNLVTEPHLENLDVLRAMRNACAHSRQDISFDTPELRRALSLLFVDDHPAKIINDHTREDCRMDFVVFAALEMTVLTGMDHKQAREALTAQLDDFRTEAIEDALENLLLGSLRRKPSGRRGPAPRRRATGRAPQRPPLTSPE